MALLLDAKPSLKNGWAALGTGNALMEEQRTFQRSYSWNVQRAAESFVFDTSAPGLHQTQ